MLCLLSLDDGTEQVYYSGMRTVAGLMWSRDGQTIAMAGTGAEQSHDGGAYLFSLSSHTRVAGPAAKAADLGFQPAERHILASVDVEGPEQLLRIREDASTPSRVIARARLPMSIRYPLVSPDRTKISNQVWETITEGKTQTLPKRLLHIAVIDGSWDRVIDTGMKHIPSFSWGAPLVSWSPDSIKLVITLREKLPAEIGGLENFLSKKAVAAK